MSISQSNVGNYNLLQQQATNRLYTPASLSTQVGTVCPLIQVPHSCPAKWVRYALSSKCPPQLQLSDPPTGHATRRRRPTCIHTSHWRNHSLAVGGVMGGSPIVT